MGILSRTNVVSIENPFSPIPLEEERNQIMYRQIGTPLGRLAKTEVSGLIKKSLESKEDRDHLKEFYPGRPEAVDEVANHMLRTFKNSQGPFTNSQ